MPTPGHRKRKRTGTYDRTCAIPHHSRHRDRRGDRAARPAAALVRAQSGLLVVASGLDNPRGLAFGPDGGLYVAEAGRGGTSTACAPAPDPPFPNRCYGPSGAITRILAVGDQRRVVVGLPSIAMANGGNAQGPVDIDFGLGAAFVTIGFGGNPALRAPLEAVGAQMGRLVRINSIGQPETLLDSRPTRRRPIQTAARSIRIRSGWTSSPMAPTTRIRVGTPSCGLR